MSANAPPSRYSIGWPAAGPDRGWKGGYFSSEEDARAFSDELRATLTRQTVAPNSPQWFNTGLHWAYGVDGPGQGHYYVDWKTGKLTKSKSAYEHPQPHACFIQGIEDDLVNEGGIMDLWVREARLFKYGSGTGSNFSRLRGEGENRPAGNAGSSESLAGPPVCGGWAYRTPCRALPSAGRPGDETGTHPRVRLRRRSPRTDEPPFALIASDSTSKTAWCSLRARRSLNRAAIASG